MFRAQRHTALAPIARLATAAIFFLAAALITLAGCAPPAHDASPAAPSGLPPEAAAVIQAILRGGPFPYRNDGVTFQNREQRLPARARGYYREYTVPTPGARDRGARRIVTGGAPPEEFYYTADHYRSFRRIDPAAIDPARTGQRR